MKANSQRNAILAWLQGGGTLTHLECLRFGWGNRLAARVCELRKEFGRDRIVAESEGNWARYRWVEPVDAQGSLFEGAA